MKKMKQIFWFTTLALCAFVLCTCSLMNSEEEDGESEGNGTQKNIVVTGVRTSDTDGNTVFGSGGCMLQVGSYFYWYGEHRYSSGNFKGISCYRSTDLVNWENRGDILTESSATDLNPCFVERPKVIYNATTKKYVLWAHRENLNYDYGLAKYMVAYGDAPDEPFTYYESRRPFDDPSFDIHDNGTSSSYYGSTTTSYENNPYGFMSRDCTLFVDDDGTAYFVSSYAENYYIHIYRLTDDYLSIDTSYWPVDNVLNTKQREAPCLFKRGSYYYMITSGTYGWTATQTEIQYATDLRGPWSTATQISDTNSTADLTHSDRSQPAYVFTLTATNGSGNTSYLYMGDRWGPAFGGSSTYDSQYVWMPLEFSSATSVDMNYSEAIKVNVEKGTVSWPTYYYIMNKAGQYLISQTSVTSGQYASWTTTAPSDSSSTTWNDEFLYEWRMIPMTNGYQIVNRYTSYALTANDNNTLSQINTATKDSDNSLQWWTVASIGTPYYSIKNYSSGYYASGTNGLTISSSWTSGETVTFYDASTAIMYQIPWKYYNPIYTSNSTMSAYLATAIINRQSWELIPVTEE